MFITKFRKTGKWAEENKEHSHPSDYVETPGTPSDGEVCQSCRAPLGGA